MVHILIQQVLDIMQVIGKQMHRFKTQLKNLAIKHLLKEIIIGTIGLILNGLLLSQILAANLKKFLCLIRLHMLLEQILHHTSVIEEQHFMLRLDLRATIGQTQNGHHHNQISVESQRRFTSLTLLLTLQEPILHPILVTEGLHSTLKEMTNLKELTKGLIS